MKRKRHHKTGFSLVEILTTIAVIAILLGFLIPALSSIEKTALNVRQRAQFHGIEIALEAFSTDMGDYPPSAYGLAAYGNYSASQRLAEALVGRDGFGFHSASRWHEFGTDMAGIPLYYPDFVPADATERDNNLALRKGPYLELENANAVKLSNLYSAVSPTSQLVDSYVLADRYKIAKNSATGKMVGSPILYYKANKGKTQHDEGSASANSADNQCTYNIYDSIGGAFFSDDSIVDLGSAATGSAHPMLNNRQWFYNETKNPNFPGDPLSGTPPRPYRADSFILQSAGPDGLYGTTDDVFNFEKEE